MRHFLVSTRTNGTVISLDRADDRCMWLLEKHVNALSVSQTIASKSLMMCKNNTNIPQYTNQRMPRQLLDVINLLNHPI
ncbi:Uncharacterized protein TCM_034202 [Theobroma cacao]|uniref:Uncharacterized protein n=1 Tax=Theobroma cacao TaxID=3641 RepID=A0A061FD58_THECC|nr:Uncharacterized protein TCM_034202 [Theobroma cacao]